MIKIKKDYKDGVVIVAEATIDDGYYSVVYYTYKGRVTDKNLIGWCSGSSKEMDELFPELSALAKVHCCDLKGCPTYAVENGFYLIKLRDKDSFIESWNISDEQYGVLNDTHTDVGYAIALRESGVLSHWLMLSELAMEDYKGLGGDVVGIKSRDYYHEPSNGDVAEYNERVGSGYYSEQNISDRNYKKRLDDLAKFVDDCIEKERRLRVENHIMIQVMNIGGAKAIDNVIFYDHTQQIKFNWADHRDQLSVEEVDKLMELLVLPDGVTFQK